MNENVVNREYLHTLLKRVHEEMKKGAPSPLDSNSEPGLEAFSSDDYSDIIGDVKSRISGEIALEEATGLESFADPGEDEEVFYLPSDPILSILQSCAEEEAMRRGASESAPENDDLVGLEAFDQFGQVDIGFLSSALALGIRKFRKPHPGGNRPPTAPRKFSDRSRMILIADWGSGIKRARKLSEVARNIIEAGQAQGIEQQVIHLGDVYYSGYGWEYEKRFLPYWPVEQSESGKIASYSLNANHDMYSGGHGYFDVLMKEPRFKPWQKESSKFSLQNKHWRILGIDTAYVDHGLHGNQNEWIRAEGEKAKAEGQKLMLLSHHQPFSLYEPVEQGNELRQRTMPLAKKGLIHSWFWGHEHRCVVYDKHDNIPFGRCIGHGGVPVYMWKKKTASKPDQAPAIYEFRDVIRKLWGLEKFALFGLVVLEFNGAEIEARYINELGVEHFSEIIS